jgi:hypothetical protein
MSRPCGSKRPHLERLRSGARHHAGVITKIDEPFSMDFVKILRVQMIDIFKGVNSKCCFPDDVIVVPNRRTANWLKDS